MSAIDKVIEIAKNDNSTLKTQNEILSNEISNLQNEVMVSAAKEVTF